MLSSFRVCANIRLSLNRRILKKPREGKAVLCQNSMWNLNWHFWAWYKWPFIREYNLSILCGQLNTFFVTCIFILQGIVLPVFAGGWAMINIGYHTCIIGTMIFYQSIIPISCCYSVIRSGNVTRRCSAYAVLTSEKQVNENFIYKINKWQVNK